ncbi:protein unc-50 homolog [Pseudomyrmex gracilis]|uniref:protein unc-50 homolog n=1 Tax=Pseudomyrmex gracilis TaxID=219809 RepID=UPI000994AC59|nr:protein unc-50 homolog [Pseudomyrmex gracilis]
MKYPTSPSTSRCQSPVLTEFSSSLPMPVYRHNCMGAATKCYKYLRKLLKFEQMDFEFALWQMIFLLVSPQKVYRNFQNRKQTKSQFARDDPAFFVLITFFYCVSVSVVGVVLGFTFFQCINFLFYMVFIEYISLGLLVTTMLWYIANRYFRIDRIQDVEWGYAFDIHLNAIFPYFILRFLQLLIYHALINSNAFSARFVGNTFYLIAGCYYAYITFLGYANVEILHIHKTHSILSTLPIMLVLYIITLCAGIDITYIVMEYYYRPWAS